MIYLLHEVQDGEGCDYTIGCGYRLTQLDADTMAGAIAEATGLDRHGSPRIQTSGEQRIKCATIYEVAAEHSIDIRALDAERKFVAVASLREEREASERAEYERLKGKYGAGAAEVRT